MNNILIIIVLYNRNIKNIRVNDFCYNLNVLIYDNSKLPQNYSENIYYIHDPQNSGVSKAYNEGIKLAYKLNKKYILLLDQDTKIKMHNIEKYIEMVKKYGDKYIYSSIICRGNKIYSPFIEKIYRNKIQFKEKFKYEEVYSLEKKSIINSGMLVPIEIINEIGSFNEKIKLDFSDIYFIEKYKKIRKEIILVNNEIEHSLSGDDGKNKERELKRYKYYCNGAKELYLFSKKRTLFLITALRMINLIIKYKTLKPIEIWFKYFLGEEIE